MKMNHSSSGYTLVELLVYIAIIGTLLTAVVLFFSAASDARVKNQTIAEVDDQGAAILDYITRTIHNATSITLPAVGASGSSLTLVVPTSGLNPTIFSLTSAAPVTIQVKEGTGVPTSLTSNDVEVSGLTFKNLSRVGTPGVVQVSFMLSRVNAGNRHEFDYQKTFVATAEVAW